MRNESHDRYSSFGSDYFMFEGKYRLIIDLCNRFIKWNKIKRQIDIGCGNGNLLGKINKYAPTYGCDISYHALKYAQQKKLRRIFCADLNYLPIKSESFDLLFVIETIEHLEEEKNALNELFRITTSGGFLIATVPAFMCIWGNHDIYYGHYRRYHKSQFLTLIKSSGFIVEYISYIEPEFFLLLYLIRKVQKIFSISTIDGLIKVPKLVNNLLIKLIELEKYWLRHFSFPFGLAIICCARKP
jgi:ubiquinone/menaquinone biosynthesis C-methylase UbiE